MAPIRVGIVGLSANSSAGSSWAKMTHLPYLKASSHYEIAGVLNSSLASSEAAIEAFDLSATAKPFGDIDAMVSDPNIDLIAVCVEVKVHASIVKAALEHGKKVYCEWPLGKNYEEANELATLAAEKGVETITGLESRASPPMIRLRELLSSGAIGSVMSTAVTGTLGPAPKVWSKRVQFYLDVHSGQSPLHTRVSHFLDAFCATVGEFESFNPLLGTHEKEVKLYDVPVFELSEAVKDPDAIFEIVKRTASDEVLLQGKLTNGAFATFHIRTGETDAEGNNLRWIIAGSEGLIEITQKTGQFLRDKSVKIKLRQGGETKYVELDWDIKGDFAGFGDLVVFTTPGRNYKALAEGNPDYIIDFQQAARRHKMLDDIIKRGLQ